MGGWWCLVSPEQFARLQSLSDRLVDTVVHDADPANWTGNGRKASELTQQERGDAHWCRKIAAGTLAILMRVHQVIDLGRERTAKDGENEAGAVKPNEPDFDLEREIKDAEREAAQQIDRLRQSTDKAAFDKYVHGGKRPPETP